MLRPIVRCTVCEASFEVGPDIHSGDRLDCPKCGKHLKVIQHSPITVDGAYEDLLEEPDRSVGSFFRRVFRN